MRGVGAAVRDEFPIFESATYLNSCSQGALSHRVRDAVEGWLAGWDANGAANENRSQVTNGTQLVQVTSARIAANAAYFAFERLDVLSGTFALVRQSNTTFGTTPTQRLIANGDSFLSWDLGSDPTTASIGVVPFVSDEDHVPPGNADGNLELFTARVPQ